jgi:hypothetical protein
VTWLGKAVFTDEDRQSLRAIALELKELRKLVMELAESLVNVSDKDLMKIFNSEQIDLKENQVEKCREKLETQLDAAEKEFR